jgi:hypothetical protein
MSDASQEINWHRVTRCPRGFRCECCGSADGPMRVIARTIDVRGVLCLTTCPTCREQIPEPWDHPSLSKRTVPKLVEQHREHLRRSPSDLSQLIERLCQEMREMTRASWPSTR